MFERFTDRARRVVVLSQDEARALNHNYIGTEHILLGLLHEGDGVATHALQAMGISLEDVRNQVVEIIGHGEVEPTGHMPFTPRGKKIFELSLREALQLGHSYIGTEHILLALIREGEGVGAKVLVKLGAELTAVRQQVIDVLSGYLANKSYVKYRIRRCCAQCGKWNIQTMDHRTSRNVFPTWRAAFNEVVAMQTEEQTLRSA